MDNTLIELQGVSKYYGESPAVQNLSFEIKKGEVFGLIGTSGCGKTTTLKMLNRLIEPTEGSININGKEITAQPPEVLRRGIGYVIQHVGLFPHYTVRQNIEVVPKLLEWKKRRINVRSEELLQLVGLDPSTFSDRLPESLSGGQQQRVGLARALAADPPLILMDEPFGALDPITKQQIRREFASLFTQIDKTIVLVTHDVFEAFGLCDRLCLLDDGVVQQVATPKELIFEPANDFIRSFFELDRFQLELMSISIGELLKVRESSELYWSPPPDEKENDVLDKEATLYQIIEKMEKGTEDNTAVIHRVDGQVIDTVSFSDLFARFQRYKKQLKARGNNG